MPLPLLLAALPALFKAGEGLSQLSEAEKLKRTDTTTAGEREILANARQRQFAGLPGLGVAQNHLAQIQANTLHNAYLGAGSGSDLLAAGAAAAAQRQHGQEALEVRDQQFHDQATAQLNQALQLKSNREQTDTNAFNQAHAALKQGGLTNLFGGLSDGASVGVYAGAGGFAKPVAGSGVPTTTAGRYVPYDLNADNGYDNYNIYGRRNSLRGVPNVFGSYQ